jgi:hypothetical protein
MKTWFASLSFLLLALAAGAQDDDTIRFIHGLPETGEDTSQQIPQEDLGAKDSIVQISHEQIPHALLRTLSREPQYKGWETDGLELDNNTKVYWIHITDKNTIRSYGFRDNGQLVSVREKNNQ